MTDSEVHAILSKDADHKSQLEALSALLTRYLPMPYSSASADPLAALQLTEKVVTLETGSMVVSRQFVSALAERLSQEDLPLEVVRELTEKAIELIQPRAISYEDQTCQLRLQLASVLERQGDSAAAARALIAINADGGQRYSGAKAQAEGAKMQLYLRIAKLLMDAGEIDRAEEYVNRASLQQTENKNDAVAIELKALNARVIDAKRRFVDAAQRYYEISQVQSVAADDRLTALQKAIICTILSGPSAARSRILDYLYKDERAAALPAYHILKQLYYERMIKLSQLEEFESHLAPHQKADEAGKSIIRAVILEHNVLAASKLYTNISLKSLAEILGVDEEKAEIIACEMISTDRLAARIDQIEGYVIFEVPDPLRLLDEQIKIACQQANLVTDMIIQAHPEFDV